MHSVAVAQQTVYERLHQSLLICLLFEVAGARAVQALEEPPTPEKKTELFVLSDTGADIWHFLVIRLYRSISLTLESCNTENEYTFVMKVSMSAHTVVYLHHQKQTLY